jgi:cadmium resistance protein CadD (predicted permease)
MNPVLSAIPIGILAFVATNLDDLFLITLFFSDPRARILPIVLGELLGILTLSALSLIGPLASFAIPLPWIGLMGFFPIFIGLKTLERSKPEAEPTLPHAKPLTLATLLPVTLMTVANGGDNIGVYTPLFASSQWVQIFTLLIVFLLMMGVWCILGYSLVNNRFTGKHIQKIGHRIFPFVLIALGFYIFAKCGTFKL